MCMCMYMMDTLNLEALTSGECGWIKVCLLARGGVEDVLDADRRFCHMLSLGRPARAPRSIVRNQLGLLGIWCLGHGYWDRGMGRHMDEHYLDHEMTVSIEELGWDKGLDGGAGRFIPLDKPVSRLPTLHSDFYHIPQSRMHHIIVIPLHICSVSDS